MSAEEIVATLRATIEAARSMFLSSSVLVNRTDVLDLLSQLETALSGGANDTAAAAALSDAQGCDANGEGAQQAPSARVDQAHRFEGAGIVSAAREQAAQLLAAAEQESAELRESTDDYVDGRLASLEISLTKTLEAVSRGREQLRGRSLFASLQPTDEDDLHEAELDLGGAKPGR